MINQTKNDVIFWLAQKGKHPNFTEALLGAADYEGVEVAVTLEGARHVVTLASPAGYDRPALYNVMPIPVRPDLRTSGGQVARVSGAQPAHVDYMPGQEVRYRLTADGAWLPGSFLRWESDDKAVVAPDGRRGEPGVVETGNLIAAPA